MVSESLGPKIDGHMPQTEGSMPQIDRYILEKYEYQFCGGVAGEASNPRAQKACIWSRRALYGPMGPMGANGAHQPMDSHSE